MKALEIPQTPKLEGGRNGPPKLDQFLGEVRFSRNVNVFRIVCHHEFAGSACGVSFPTIRLFFEVPLLPSRICLECLWRTFPTVRLIFFSPLFLHAVLSSLWHDLLRRGAVGSIGGQERTVSSASGR